MTRARMAVIAALAVAVLVLAFVFFTGGSSYKYTFVFQNAAQLVPDNQVLIGGSPAGTVEDIELSDDNLAVLHVKIDQELHEGTTAVIRATSLSGVANHYVSVSPGPNSNPAIEDGGEVGLGSTTTPIDIDQFFNTFPPVVRKGLTNFIKGNAAMFEDRGEDANEAYKYFGPALNRTGAFVRELNADENLFAKFLVSSGALSKTISERGEELSSAISNADTAFSAIATQNVALDKTLRRLPPVMRQANTTFVNLRAALDDVDPLVEAAKPATKNLAPFLADLRPILSDLVPFMRNLRLTVARPGKANDAAELLAALPVVHRKAAKTFPNAERAMADFQPNLNLFRAYTPDLFNAIGKLGQVTGYYDGNGHYVRAGAAMQNIFTNNGGVLTPITKSQQYDDLIGKTAVKKRCPGGATQPATDGSNPFVNPPHAGAISNSECDPAAVPPGP